MSWVWFLIRVNIFSLDHDIRISSGAKPASYPMGTKGCGQNMNLVTHFHLVPRLRMCGYLPVLHVAQLQILPRNCGFGLICKRAEYWRYVIHSCLHCYIVCFLYICIVPMWCIMWSLFNRFPLSEFFTHTYFWCQKQYNLLSVSMGHKNARKFFTAHSYEHPA
jgi:hypothetical protein